MCVVEANIIIDSERMQFIHQEFHTGGIDRGVCACMVQANVARENYTLIKIKILPYTTVIIHQLNL